MYKCCPQVYELQRTGANQSEGEVSALSKDKDCQESLGKGRHFQEMGRNHLGKEACLQAKGFVSFAHF